MDKRRQKRKQQQRATDTDTARKVTANVEPPNSPAFIPPIFVDSETSSDEDDPEQPKIFCRNISDMLTTTRSSKRGSNVPKRYRDFEISTPPPQKVQIMSKKPKEKETSIINSQAQRRPVTPSSVVPSKPKEKLDQLSNVKKASTPTPTVPAATVKKPELLAVKQAVAKVEAVALPSVKKPIIMKSQTAQTKFTCSGGITGLIDDKFHLNCFHCYEIFSIDEWQQFMEHVKSEHFLNVAEETTKAKTVEDSAKNSNILKKRLERLRLSLESSISSIHLKPEEDDMNDTDSQQLENDDDWADLVGEVEQEVNDQQAKNDSDDFDFSTRKKIVVKPNALQKSTLDKENNASKSVPATANVKEESKKLPHIPVKRIDAGSYNKKVISPSKEVVTESLKDTVSTKSDKAKNLNAKDEKSYELLPNDNSNKTAVATTFNGHNSNSIILRGSDGKRYVLPLKTQTAPLSGPPAKHILPKETLLTRIRDENDVSENEKDADDPGDADDIAEDNADANDINDVDVDVVDDNDHEEVSYQISAAVDDDDDDEDDDVVLHDAAPAETTPSAVIKDKIKYIARGRPPANGKKGKKPRKEKVDSGESYFKDLEWEDEMPSNDEEEDDVPKPTNGCGILFGLTNRTVVLEFIKEFKEREILWDTKPSREVTHEDFMENIVEMCNNINEKFNIDIKKTEMSLSLQRIKDWYCHTLYEREKYEKEILAENYNAPAFKLNFPEYFDLLGEFLKPEVIFTKHVLLTLKNEDIDMPLSQFPKWMVYKTCGVNVLQPSTKPEKFPKVMDIKSQFKMVNSPLSPSMKVEYNEYVEDGDGGYVYAGGKENENGELEKDLKELIEYDPESDQEKLQYIEVEVARHVKFIERPRLKRNYVPLNISCEHCSRVFKRKNDYLRHLKLHSPPQFECTKCGRKYRFKHFAEKCSHFPNIYASGRKKYPYQYERANKFKNWICEICGNRYNSVGSLNVHKRDKHFNQRLKCVVCKFSSISNYRIVQHQKKRHIVEFGTCEELLKKSKARMDSKTPFTPQQRMAFEWRRDMRKKLQPGQLFYGCFKCNIVFNTRSEKLLHNKQEHPIQDTTVICLLCNHDNGVYTMSTSNSLRRHYEVTHKVEWDEIDDLVKKTKPLSVMLTPEEYEKLTSSENYKEELKNLLGNGRLEKLQAEVQSKLKADRETNRAVEILSNEMITAKTEMPDYEYQQQQQQYHQQRLAYQQDDDDEDLKKIKADLKKTLEGDGQEYEVSVYDESLEEDQEFEDEPQDEDDESDFIEALMDNREEHLVEEHNYQQHHAGNSIEGPTIIYTNSAEDGGEEEIVDYHEMEVEHVEVYENVNDVEHADGAEHHGYGETFVIEETVIEDGQEVAEYFTVENE